MDDEVEIVHESIVGPSLGNSTIRGAMKRQQTTLMGTKASPPAKRRTFAFKKTNTVSASTSSEDPKPLETHNTGAPDFPGFKKASTLMSQFQCKASFKKDGSGFSSASLGPLSFKIESALTSDLSAPSQSRTSFKEVVSSASKDRAPFKKANFMLPGSGASSQGELSFKIESALTSDLSVASKEEADESTAISTKPPLTRSRYGHGRKRSSWSDELAAKCEKTFPEGGEEASPFPILYLPEEVQRRILISLPEDDIRSCLRVCRWWWRLIKDPHFMKWKKTYHRFSSELQDQDIRASHVRQNAWERLTSLLQSPAPVVKLYELDLAMHAVSVLLPDLLAHLNKLFPATAAYLQPYLSSLPKWSSVGEWLSQKAPKSLHASSQEPQTWPFLAACLLQAKELKEVDWIWTTLRKQYSECHCEITEFLYAFAYHLRLCTIVCPAGPWTRAHYRTIYRLRAAEFSGGVRLEQLKDRLIGSASTGQQTILRYGTHDSRMRLTHEQLKIARHQLQPQDVIRINAFAGSGKTTTLLNFARFNPNKSFLLVVYNKAAQLHAHRIFPSNVVCRTGHSLAFHVFGRRFRHKLNNLKHRDLMELLPEQSSERGSLARRVKLAKHTIEAFLSSSEFEISSALVRNDCNSYERKTAVIEAKKVWEAMQDFDSKVPMTHDGYLKLWQLSKPSLGPYDAILIDEAQDMNPCILDVVQRQSQPKIFVGDPHQQIYAFRGSVNVLDLLEATHTYNLTQSFRFGEPIAFAAQTILNQLKGEPNLLTGSAKNSSIHGDFKEEDQLTVICRNNANVFKVAYEVTRSSMHSVHVIGGLDGLGVKTMIQVYYMTLPAEERTGSKEITDRFLIRFADPNGSLYRLKMYASQAEDIELSERIKVVECFGAGLLHAITQIKTLYTCDQARAHYIVTTAHKSKGLEFGSVLLHNDLEALPDSPVEEANLLYVASTRAKRFLKPNMRLELLLHRHGEMNSLQEHEQRGAAQRHNIISKLMGLPLQLLVF